MGESEYEFFDDHRARAVWELLQRRRAYAMAVLTNDSAVRACLRRLGEPITLFGEREVERRDRLGALMVHFEAEAEFRDHHRAERERRAVNHYNRAYTMVMPTNDSAVRARLRRLGEPITFFGELEVERRDRLGALMVRPEADGSIDLILAQEDSQAARAGVDEEEIQYPFSTEGTPFSTEGTQQLPWIERAERRQEDPDEDSEAEAELVVKQVETECSEIGDDRPLTGSSRDESSMMSWRQQIKPIQNKQRRQVTFSKRRMTLFNKASELSCLCGANVAAIVVSPANRMSAIGCPSVDYVLHRYVPLSDEEGASEANLNCAADREEVKSILRQIEKTKAQLAEEQVRMNIIGDKITQAMDNKQYLWEANLEELGEAELVEYTKALERLKFKLQRRLASGVIPPSSSTQ